MGRKGKRVTLDTNIYADGSGIGVCVSGFPEKRFDAGTPLVLLQQARNALKDAKKKQKATGPATLQRDCVKYQRRKQHLQNQSSVSAELRAWCDLYGDKSRYSITRDDVLDARAEWLEQGLAPKTINNRVHRLRALYRELDGLKAWSPADDILPLAVSRTPIQRISPGLVLSVLQKMAEAKFPKRLAKTRARFMVYATTGRRPSEIARAAKTDVDFENRVWVPRDGKGGHTPGIYLNDDMLVAWKAFAAANAWGRFNSRVFPRTIRKYGWPAGVRPYNLRHTIGISLSEAGFDLADIGPHLGHRQIETTRKYYVPVLNSRMQTMSDHIGQRFGFDVPQIGSINASETGPLTPSNGRAVAQGKPKENAG